MVLQFLPQTCFFTTFTHGGPCFSVHTGLLPWAGYLSGAHFLVFISYKRFYPWHVSSSPVGLVLPSPHHIEIHFSLKDSGDANITTHGSLLSLFSLPIAFGQRLPALAPLPCSKVWCPKVLIHLPQHALSISSHIWLLNLAPTLGPSRSAATFLTLQAHVLRAHDMLLTVTFYSAEGLGGAQSCLVQSVSIVLGVPCFPRWASLSWPSLSWTGSYFSQASNSNLCSPNVPLA